MTTTKQLHWTPNQVGTYQVPIEVVDEKGNKTVQMVTINVREAESPSPTVIVEPTPLPQMTSFSAVALVVIILVFASLAFIINKFK